MSQSRYQRAIVVFCFCAWAFADVRATGAQEIPLPQAGLASWYGEEHRGRLMANGRKFDPDKLTAASWFYPLGTRVRVTVRSPNFEPRSVLVTITDRGPAKRLVQQGRVIDLAHGAFERIAEPDIGLMEVSVEPVR